MQFLHAITTVLSLSALSSLAATKSLDSFDGLNQIRNGSPSLSAETIFRRNSQIASQLAEGPARGVRKMSDYEGEKFFLDYWDFVGSSGALTERSLPESVNLTTVETESENGYSPARFVDQSYPFEFSFPPEFEEGLQARDFKCPTGTSACTNIDRSDRCCGSGETCEIVADTGHGDVGCCAKEKTCSGLIGSCANDYTACSQALGGGCCIPGYDCVDGGCAYITVITVTIHSSVVLSTVTYSSIPQTSASSTATDTTSYSSSTTTNDSLAPPGRPTSLSTATSSTRGDDLCPTGFYACSAVYHGGCCRTGRNCDTTSCPTIISTTLVSDGVTIVVPVATTTGGSTGNRCANGWFHCADSVGGGCCPRGFACGSSCTATDTASATTVAKEQATSGDGSELRASSMLLISVLWCLWIM